MILPDQTTLLENERIASGDLLLIRKPKGWTSFDVVKKVRGILRVRKAGHAGTLDPLATGLLIIGTNAQTKVLSRFLELEKEYLVTMRLGGRTESYDSETPCIDEPVEVFVTPDQLQSVLRDFVGERFQVPPMYSAVKMHGKPLYKYAWKGQVFHREKRKVFIRAISVVSFALPDVTLNVTCSRGTYVRTLVDDIGASLGCGAFMTALERVRIGEYRLENALSLAELTQQNLRRSA